MGVPVSAGFDSSNTLVLRGGKRAAEEAGQGRDGLAAGVLCWRIFGEATGGETVTGNVAAPTLPAEGHSDQATHLQAE